MSLCTYARLAATLDGLEEDLSVPDVLLLVVGYLGLFGCVVNVQVWVCRVRPRGTPACDRPCFVVRPAAWHAQTHDRSWLRAPSRPDPVCFLKVMAYVLSHDDLRQHLESTVAHLEGRDGSDDGSGTGGDGAADGGEGAAAAGPSREAPEDLVEVLCGDRVVEPHLYIGACA